MPIKSQNQHKFIVLLCLYIAQAVPMSFFTTVVPVIMRTENYSLETIGLLQLVKLPWIVKFLWAPLVDKTSVSLNSYIRWIIYSELFYAITIIAVGFFSLETNFMLIVILVLVAVTASATQDIATDATAVLMLKKNERSWGNGIQSAGGFIGSLLGSGVLLLTFHYFGWRVLITCLALLVLVALIPLLLFKKRIKNNQIISAISAPIRYSNIHLFFKQNGIGKQLLLLILFYSGVAGILAMLKPFLVDLEYTIEQIGIMSGIVGTSAAALCAILAGMIIKKIGVLRAAILFSALILITACYFFWLTTGHYYTPLLYIGITLLWGVYGMAMVLVYTTSMNFVRKGYEGTDFTLQTVIAQLASLIFAVLSGKLAHVFSYKGLFFVEILMALATLLFIIFIYQKTRNKNKTQ